MKIITDNAAYVQMNDITFLNHCDLPIPASVFMTSFGFGIFWTEIHAMFVFPKFQSTGRSQNISYFIFAFRSTNHRCGKNRQHFSFQRNFQKK